MRFNHKQFRLPKSIVLKNKKSISRIFEIGTHHRNPIFNTVILDTGTTRVAFLVRNRLGNAVKRNQMKRFLREAYRLKRDKFKGKETIFYIKHYCKDFIYILKKVDSL